MKKPMLSIALLMSGLLIGTGAVAKPVTYTLYTVSDGMLGTVPFTEAKVTITFVGDTKNVVSTVQGGATILTNSSGSATVTITRGYTPIVAKFARGQIYARYDVTNGIVGFGSTLGATYPLALDCNQESCSSGIGTTVYILDYGIAAALAHLLTNPADASLYTRAVLAEHASLSQATLLTGLTHACLQDYLTGYVCSVTPSTLATDRGGFYLQDISLEHNEGIFRVQVSTGDD